MHTDRSFFTNQSGETLQERFGVLIKHCQFFDCLVSYFYLSGFHALYPQLKDTDEIRILIGMQAEAEIHRLVHRAHEQRDFNFSTDNEAIEMTRQNIKDEMERSDDNQHVEEGVHKFMEWLKNGKLKIRFYPDRPIHAKVYIMTFKKDSMDQGRVITGSSNFSRSGFVDNIEFNVELKNRNDYDFAKQEFEQLWQRSIDLREQYQDTIEQHTWLRPRIKPYELYLKFLYEYFNDDLSESDEAPAHPDNLPTGYMDLEYQRQAVRNAKKILLEYGGVFISDVVGLGKTYIAALLTRQIGGKTLVIAPPALLDLANPGSWRNVLFNAGVLAHYESIGKLDTILEQGTERYQNIIIDEAHRFRNDETSSHEKLMEICRSKRIILVTATPYHNKPNDILSLLRLFQNVRQSTIPNVPNLEEFFKKQQAKIDRYNRDEKHSQYIRAAQNSTRTIRTSVLKHIMVRRTRMEVQKYFAKDLKKQKLRFPKINKPIRLVYELDEKENTVFDNTIKRIAQGLIYARYKPMLYYVGEQTVSSLQKQSQQNMGGFMKILLCKRLESSFWAFEKSIGRFLNSYEQVIKTYQDKGLVYVSKGYSAKLYELLAMDDDAEIQKLIAAGKTNAYPAETFLPTFIEDLYKDYKLLQTIQSDWQGITTDPKLTELLNQLKSEKTMQKHLLIFTEAKETAEYLSKKIAAKLDTSPLLFTSRSKPAERKKVTDNFDANSPTPSDEHRILISTEILSEGVNLHRANTVINYDLPWNPTRMMQRVGRINRVDTRAKEIHTFNFFPAEEADEQLKLIENVKRKIHAFLNLLGGDAELLTEGEPVNSHALFERLTSEQALMGEDPQEKSELKYLAVIRDIQTKNTQLFEHIKNLPKKARTARASSTDTSSLLTYFRQGKIQKFFCSTQHKASKELDFITTAEVLECKPGAPFKALPKWFYKDLDKNKAAFKNATHKPAQGETRASGTSSATKIIDLLRIKKEPIEVLTEQHEESTRYIRKVKNSIKQGRLPPRILRKTRRELGKMLKSDIKKPLKVYAILKTCIPPAFLQKHYSEKTTTDPKPQEIILSLCLTTE